MERWPLHQLRNNAYWNISTLSQGIWFGADEVLTRGTYIESSGIYKFKLNIFMLSIYELAWIPNDIYYLIYQFDITTDTLLNLIISDP